MDLDWCLICEQKTQGSLYCSEECKFKDHLSAYTSLTPPDSPTSSGSSTPTDNNSVSIATNNSFVYPFYRKSSSCFRRPPIISNNADHKNNMDIHVLHPPTKKLQSALNSAFKNAIEMPSVKDPDANLARSLNTRHLHI